MKYSALLNLKAVYDNGWDLTANHLVILDVIVSMINSRKFISMTDSNGTWFWCKVSLILDQAPILQMKERRCKDLINDLCNCGLIEANKDNQKLYTHYIRIGENYCNYEFSNQNNNEKNAQTYTQKQQPYAENCVPPTQNIAYPYAENCVPPTQNIADYNIINNKTINNKTINNNISISEKNFSQNGDFENIEIEEEFIDPNFSSAKRHAEKTTPPPQKSGLERVEMKKIIQSTIEAENKRYNREWAFMYDNLSKKDSESFMELEKQFLELDPNKETRLLAFEKYIKAAYEKNATEFKRETVFTPTWILSLMPYLKPILIKEGQEALKKQERDQKLRDIFSTPKSEPTEQPKDVPPPPHKEIKGQYSRYAKDENGKIEIEYSDDPFFTDSKKIAINTNVSKHF